MGAVAGRPLIRSACVRMQPESSGRMSYTGGLRVNAGRMSRHGRAAMGEGQRVMRTALLVLAASLFAGCGTEGTREGDPRSTTVETIESDEDIIRMTWYD